MSTFFDGKIPWWYWQPRLMINIHLLWQNNCLLCCVWPLWHPQREPQKWMVGRNSQIKVFNTCCGFFLVLQSIPEDLGYAVRGRGFHEDYALIFSGAFRITPAGSLKNLQDPGFIIKFFPVGTINDRDSSGKDLLPTHSHTHPRSCRAWKHTWGACDSSLRCSC